LEDIFFDFIDSKLSPNRIFSREITCLSILGAVNEEIIRFTSYLLSKLGPKLSAYMYINIAKRLNISISARPNRSKYHILNCLENGSIDGPIGNKKSPSFDSSSRNINRALIILADDDADDRDLFSEAMEECCINVTVETAKDGIELVKLLKNTNRTPDLIFLDLNMPNKNGKECLIEIRKSQALKHLPVIIYSTSSSQRDIEFTFEKGANLFISKPSSYKELVQIAKKVLALDWKKFQPKSNKDQYVFSLKD